MIEFDDKLCSNLAAAMGKEWLVTNGIGGYCSSTVAGLNTRRYHGLLVAATKPPVGRYVLLSQLEDVVVVDGKRFDLSTNLYLNSIVHPAGHMNLRGFSLDSFPIYNYCQGEWQITKSVWMVHGENTTVIEYVFSSNHDHGDVSLEVRPLVAFRDYRGTTRENHVLNRSVVQTAAGVAFHPYPDLPTLYLAHDTAIVQADGYWYKNFEYVEERTRGIDFTEDLFSPLIFKADLTRARRFCIIASTERRSTTMVAEYKRSELHRASLQHYKYRAEFGQSDLIPLLYRAADQFIVSRYPRQTVLAGGTWFADWGGESMVGLPGLLLETDRPDLAREILLQYAAHIADNMLPNRIADAGEQAAYTAVDATLWFFEAIRQYFHYRKDETWREKATQFIADHLYVPLQGIVRAHLAGMDEEGFLWAGGLTTQMTWENSCDGDAATNPRAGRPVEIQALWYNALRTLEDFARLFSDPLAASIYAELAGKLKANFEAAIWNQPGAFLYDAADLAQSNGALCPDHIFAVSLHHSLLSPERASRVLDLIEREVLALPGPRPRSSNGSPDSASDTGALWPWLAGPFFVARLRVSNLPEETIVDIACWLEQLARHLRDAASGQIAGMFDGNISQAPRGCIAQAWSVAQILRVAKLVIKHPSTKLKANSPAQ